MRLLAVNPSCSAILLHWMLILSLCPKARALKEKLEMRLGTELQYCAIAMPAGTEDSVKTHQYIAEGAGLEVTNILDEPSAANAIYQIEDGVVVDIGGGTTGLAILKNGIVTQIEDEPTGGTHLSLVLAGNYKISFEEAEEIKQDYKRHREIFPVVKPVLEKMATIVTRYVKKEDVDTLYLCGGTCCLTGIETVFEKVTGIHTVKPANQAVSRCPASNQLKSVFESLAHLLYRNQLYYNSALLLRFQPAPSAHDLQVRPPMRPSPRDSLLSIFNNCFTQPFHPVYSS